MQFHAGAPTLSTRNYSSGGPQAGTRSQPNSRPGSKAVGIAVTFSGPGAGAITDPVSISFSKTGAITRAPAGPPTIKTATKAGIGDYLVDAKGMTLYYFTRDVIGKSNAAGPVLVAWPIFYTEKIVVPAGLKAEDFGAITRDDGKMQSTYKGWPLYYFAKDQAVGDTLGEGVAGVWFVLKVPFYSIMEQTKADVGNYLVDAKGMTLYYFTRDVIGKSNAAGPVLVAWPIFYDSDNVAVSSLKGEDFGTITRDDGKKQTTYKGWPLYYFAKDQASGDTLGEGVGGVWFVMKVPFYSVMLENKAGVGNYLVDAKGKTLYYFTKDVMGKSNATSTVLQAWPIFYASDNRVVSSLNPSDLATITRDDGQKQATFRGWPLYYYAKDLASGDTMGEGVGGFWFVLKVPYYSVMLETKDVGTYLVDAYGKALYYYTGDYASKSNTTGAMLQAWPPFYTSDNVVVSTLNATDLATITRSDGSKQTTYKGWPVYNYAGDTAPGSTLGQGSLSMWFLIMPDKIPMPSAPPAGGGGGGGGY